MPETAFPSVDQFERQRLPAQPTVQERPPTAAGSFPSVEEFEQRQRTPSAAAEGPPVLPPVQGVGIPSSSPFTVSSNTPQVPSEFGPSRFLEMGALAGQTLAHYTPSPTSQTTPQPTSRVPQVGPSRIPPLPEEHTLRLAQQEYDALPPAVRNPSYRIAETGPVSDKAFHWTWALSRYAAQAPQIQTGINKEVQDVNTLGKQLEVARRNESRLSLQERQHLDTQVAVYKQRSAAVQRRSDELKQNVAAWQRLNQRPLTLSDTTRFRGEPDRVQSFGPLENIVPGMGTRAALREVPKARGELFLAGLAPPPLINPGKTPEEKLAYSQQLVGVRDFVRHNFHYLAHPPNVPQDRLAQIQSQTVHAVYSRMTPWQRQMVEPMRRQVAFEELAERRAKVGETALAELGTGALIEMVAPELGGVAGRVVGAPIRKVLGRSLAEAALEEQLNRFAGRKVMGLTTATLRRFALEKAPQVAGHAAVGGIVGGPTMAGITLAQGGTPLQAAQTGVQSIPEMAALGGIFSLISPTEAPEHPASKVPQRIAAERTQVSPAHLNQVTVDGQTLNLRRHDPAQLEQIRDTLTAHRTAGMATHPEQVAEAAINAHLDRHAKYQDRQAIEFTSPQEVKRYTDRWNSLKERERSQHDVLSTTAERLRPINPDLAAKLDTAALQANKDFQHRFRVEQENKLQRDLQPVSERGPAEASIWRYLTPEEQNLLPARAKRELLVQDLSNSRQVIQSGTMPDNAPKGWAATDLGKLEKQADDAYHQAEETHHREITAVAHEAVGPEPIPTTPAFTGMPPVPAAVRRSGKRGTQAGKKALVVSAPPQEAAPAVGLGPERAKAETAAELERVGMQPAEAARAAEQAEPIAQAPSLEEQLARLQEERKQYKLGSKEFGTLTSQIGKVQDQLAVKQHQEGIGEKAPTSEEAQQQFMSRVEAGIATPEEIAAQTKPPIEEVKPKEVVSKPKISVKKELPRATEKVPAQPPTAAYQSGQVLKSKLLGAIIRLENPTEKPGQWRMTVVDKGKTGWVKGENLPITEDSLSKFEAIKEKGKRVVQTLKEQLKSEEGAITPSEFGRKGGIKVPEFGRKGGQKGDEEAAKSLKNWGDPDKFFEPDAQEAFNRDRTTKSTNVYQRAGRSFIEGAQNIVKAFSRSYEHLESGPKYAGVRDLLDLRKRSVDMSHLKAQLQLGRALNSFTPREIDLFDSGWYALAMKEDIENQYAMHLDKGKDPKDFEPVLPPGHTEQSAVAAFNKTVEGMKGLDRVSRALSHMHDLNQEVWDEYRTAYERATGRKMDSNIFFYFRHLIHAYNEEGQVVGPGKVRIKRPGFTLHRDHSPLAYSSNFIRATMDWMPHAIRETINLKLAHHTDEVHNIGPGIAFERIKRQNPDIYQHLKDLVAPRDIQVDPNIISKMGELASKDFLPDSANGRFQPLIESLHNYWQFNREFGPQGMANIQFPQILRGELTDYGRWLFQKELNRGPRAITEIPPGYVEYPIERLQRAFQTFSVPERIGQEAQNKIADELIPIPAEQIKKVLAVGRTRQGMIIPKELAKTFDNTGLQRPDNFDTQTNNFFAKLQQGWKWETLLNPLHVPRYIAKTFPLHFGPVLRKAPGAIKSLGWATKQIQDVGVRKIAPTDPVMKAWVDRGGMGSTQYQWEGLKAGDLGKFAAETPDILTRGVQKGISFLRAPHDWRERTLRLSTFRYFVDQMQTSPDGMPRDFAASNPQEIQALPNIYDRAWRLSDDLNIPYGRTSAAGKLWGRYMSPFWAVQEHIVRREGQFLRNLWDAPAVNLAMGRKIAGNSVGLSRAIDIGKFAAKLTTAALAFEALNNITPRQREAEKRMDPVDRFLPHVTVGYDAINQTAITVPIASNFFEATRWFGLDHIPQYWDDYINHRASIGDILKDMAWAPVNELYKTLGPQWKIPMEWVPALRRFPDFRHPIPVHDRWEEAFRMVGADGIYRMIHNYPQPKGYWPRTFFALRTIDLGETAYNDTRETVQRFRAKEGLQDRGVTISDDPRTLLLYRMRQALRLGDKKSAFRYAVQGANNPEIHLTDKDYVQSTMGAEPLRMINPGAHPAMARKFTEGLSSTDQDKLRRAYYWWQMTFAPNASIDGLKDMELDRFIPAMHAVVKSAASQDIPITQAMQANQAVEEKILDVRRRRALQRR